MKATRRQAREWAIQLLTAADLNPPSSDETFLADTWPLIEALEISEGGVSEPIGGKPRAFAEERVLGVLKSVRELDELLSPLLKDWDLDRLGTVERAVLRLGAWELTKTDVPRPVVINEAIDLVNWFSSPRSRTLVNGVLDHVPSPAQPR